MSAGAFGEGGLVENAGDVSLSSSFSIMPLLPDPCESTVSIHPGVASSNIGSVVLEVMGRSG
jgi:hypothetical protein